MTLRGIDISNNQKSIAWPAVAASGVEFALIKATEGSGYLDLYLDANWAGATLNGLLRGAYHFALPSKNSAEAEAAWFLEQRPILQPGDIVALDLEDDSDPKANLLDWALTWLSTVEAALGFAPLLYSRAEYLTRHGLTDPRLAAYGLWLADWGSAMPPPPAPWPFVALWQYSSTGAVPGITGAVDLDQFNGDASQFRAYGLPSVVPDLEARVAVLEAQMARMNLVLTRRMTLVRAALDPLNPPGGTP